MLELFCLNKRTLMYVSFTYIIATKIRRFFNIPKNLPQNVKRFNKFHKEKPFATIVEVQETLFSLHR